MVASVHIFFRHFLGDYAFNGVFPFSLSHFCHTHTHNIVSSQKKWKRAAKLNNIKIIPIWVVLKNDWKYFVKRLFLVFRHSMLDARWLAACLLGPAVVNVWEIKRGANWRQVKKPSESLSSTYAHGTVRISHWNRIAFILKYQLRERRTMAIHIAAFI